MKKIEIKLLVLVLSSVFLSVSVFAQKTSIIKGAIGTDKDEDMVVVCVLGTAACMPLEIDDSINIKFNGKTVSLKDLPVGAYIEIVMVESDNGIDQISNITSDINKTVFCFNKLDYEAKENLILLLDQTNGVNNYKYFDASSQMYIEYDHELVNYNNIKKTIVNAGYELE
ncbi:MAG: hypothetical protein KJ754_03790 [Bacteroidetes bacterium]|nr:hypothetical protein [Bacteroidota bacterium]MBU1578524.1 hypothetical protein [Bacteroidota bacterium]MBU2466716.1 hypothetical protein [Bacteroidota bacterium]